MVDVEVAAAPAPVAREAQRDTYERYMPLVRRIAVRTVRHLPPGLMIDDIVSVGWLGLTEALKRRTEEMDEEQFQAYASYRIRGSILDYLREVDPLSRKLRGASRRITETIARLASALGRMPEEAEVAGDLGISLAEYHDLLTSISNAQLVRLEVLPAGEPMASDDCPETLVSRKEITDAIAGAFERLPERLQLVLGLHYQEGCTLREIGEVLGVGESRACQLHGQAVHMIRAMIERRPAVTPKQGGSPQSGAFAPTTEGPRDTASASGLQHVGRRSPVPGPGR